MKSVGSARAAWRLIATAPEGEVVETRVIDVSHGERNVQPLVRKGRLWWLADASMYVYYTPTHWRPMADDAQRRGHE